MIITRTPLRISFFGGGTDYPVWYEKNGGAVISTSIDKYSYITCRYLPAFFDYKYLIKYSKIEKAASREEIDHPSVRETLKFVGLERGIELAYTNDVPALSGLGSSSAFTVGLLHALYALQGKLVTKRQLALDAIHIEQKKIEESVGSQDQVASALGGFNKIVFGGPETFTHTPLAFNPKKVQTLQNHLLLFFTAITRNASEIAREQIKFTPQKEKELQTLASFVPEAEHILNNPSENLDDFGRLLDESWKIKRELSSKITTPVIDSIYETAKRAGALGGKLLGAGGGGFMLLFVKPEDQPAVKEQLRHLIHIPFAFERSGSQIIYYDPPSNY